MQREANTLFNISADSLRLNICLALDITRLNKKELDKKYFESFTTAYIVSKQTKSKIKQPDKARDTVAFLF